MNFSEGIASSDGSKSVIWERKRFFRDSEFKLKIWSDKEMNFENNTG